MLELEMVCPPHVLLAEGKTRMFTIHIVDGKMIWEATGNLETGISVGGRIINTIRYAADKALVANSQKGLQQLMDNMNIVTKDLVWK